MRPFAKYFLMLVAAATVYSARPAAAWNGYPPYGAWAYGSYKVPVRGCFRTRGVAYGTHYGWGGYGNLGFAATTRIHHGFHRTFVRYRSPTLRYHVSYPRYYAPVAYYRSCFPLVSYPLAPVYYHVAPVVTYPVYSVPTCVTQTYTAPTIRTTPLPQNNVPVVPAPAPGNNAPTNAAPLPAPTTDHARNGRFNFVSDRIDTNLSSKLVMIEPEKREPPKDVPQRLLDAADAILINGGYREATTAYARLSVLYGSNEVLLGRRFVAQVAAGHWEQAELIADLASLSGKTISGTDLPGGDLQSFVQVPVLVEMINERLAARALQRPSDAGALASIATWLDLQGDQERAELFRTRIEQLRTEMPAEENSFAERDPSTPVDLVSLSTR